MFAMKFMFKLLTDLLVFASVKRTSPLKVWELHCYSNGPLSPRGGFNQVRVFMIKCSPQLMAFELLMLLLKPQVWSCFLIFRST